MLQLFSPNSTFGRWMGFFLDALLVSIAWAVCCLPVITIGASTAALHRVAHNWMKNRSECDLKHFFTAFGENFKGGTAIWLILLLPLALILYNAYAVWIALVSVVPAVKWMILIAALVWMFTAVYAFALQAIFENTAMRTVLNALRIAVSHIKTTVILVVMFALAIFLTLVYPPGAVLYVPVCVFLGARPVWGVFSRVIGRDDVIVEVPDEMKEGE